MKYFTLRLEPVGDSVHTTAWRAYVAEVETGGKDVTPSTFQVGYGNDPLAAVSRLATNQAMRIDKQMSSPHRGREHKKG